MTEAPRIARWKLVAKYLSDARDQGSLGIVAASTNIAEYKLHDFAKLGGNVSEDQTILTYHELSKLYQYFQSKDQG
jgi:hypothetical protein